MGTGPSLTPEIIAAAIQARKENKIRLFGCNAAIFAAPLDVHLACNIGWWVHYAQQVKDLPCSFWTPRREIADLHSWVNFIEERWESGISIDPSWICAHHGSGPQIVNLAYHFGCRRMLLVGWDMRFAAKVSNTEYQAPRHFFAGGEYPAEIQHWPRTGPNGELTGLIKEMETIRPEDYGLEIINCSPGSAMTCFPMGKLEDFII